MGQVFRQGELNLSALKNDDAYILIAEPANTQIEGVETGVAGIVGSASWGPMNSPVRLGSSEAAIRTFGPPKNASKDMPSDIWIFQQLRTPVVVGVRVGDGTEAKSTSALATAGKGTITVGGTFAAGGTITATIGGVAVTLLVTAAHVSLSGVAAALANAINQNLAAYALVYAYANGAVVQIIGRSASNTTTLTTSIASGGTLTVTASGATFAGGGTGIGTFTALYNGTEGNNLTYQFAPGDNTTGAAPTWNLTINRSGLVPESELFTNLAESTLAASITSALQSGQGVSRGPSKLARFTAAGGGATAPNLGLLTATGGANGDTNVTSSQQLGTNQALPATGMYALKDQGVQKLGLCGHSDSTSWATMIAFAKQIGAGAALVFPANTDTSTAIAAKKAAGIDDFTAFWMKDWVQYLDTVNSTLRLVSPMPFILGKMCSLTPEQSPANKPVDLVVATERTLAESPYSNDECGLLASAGIMFITNPCPGGDYFGIRNGQNGSSNNAINGVEYTNLTHFLAWSLKDNLGEFVGRVQTTREDDPTRSAARTKLNNFFTDVKANGYIEDFRVDMSFGEGKVNTTQSVQDGFLKAVVRVKYKSIVRFFIVTLLAGKTVDVTSSIAAA